MHAADHGLNFVNRVALQEFFGGSKKVKATVARDSKIKRIFQTSTHNNTSHDKVHSLRAFQSGHSLFVRQRDLSQQQRACHKERAVSTQQQPRG
jgi:carbamoylphosphate synthase large subunit